MRENETMKAASLADDDDREIGLPHTSENIENPADDTELIAKQHRSETTLVTAGDETQHLSEEFEDRDAMGAYNERSSDASSSTLDCNYHIFRNFQPHQYTAKVLQRQRLLHGFKVACAVLLASQFVLIDS